MKQGEVNIGEAGPEDLAVMAGLLGELFAIEKDFAIDPVRQRHGLKLLLASPWACLFKAEAGGAVVGMVTGQLVASTAEGGLSLWAEDLVVAPAWRGRGVGAGLMRALEAWARNEGAVRMQLLADRDNANGLAFHRKHGWQDTSMICLRKLSD